MEKHEPGISPKSIFWIAATALLIALVTYVIMSGAQVKKIDVPGIFGVEFETDSNPQSKTDAQATPPVSGQLVQHTNELERKVAQLEQKELERRNAELQRRLQELEQRATEREQTSSSASLVNDTPPSANEPIETNISGTWHSEDDFTYIFSQAGNNVTMQEINPTLNIIQSIGEGQMDGNAIALKVQTILGIGGTLTLHVEDEGSSLNGTFIDELTHTAQPIALYR